MNANNVWYAVMTDRQDTDWGFGSADREEAEKMVVNRLDTCPDAYIAVIEGGEDPVCVEEITPEDFSPVYMYAARIVKAHDWDGTQDDIAALARWLDMEDAWQAADGDTWEAVLLEMGKKIGVELI